jgi:hypothetical protein
MPPNTPSGTWFFASIGAREMLLELLPLRSLIVLAGTARLQHEAMYTYIQHHIVRFISQFFVSPYTFLQILRKTNGVVSGSGALSVLCAVETSGWIANDLDIYILNGQPQTVMLRKFLNASGFSRRSLSCSHPYSRGNIKSVGTFIHGSNKVDIIESCTQSAFSPILACHLTTVINYFSADTIFSAYPTLTGQHRGIINPKIVRPGQTSTADFVLQTHINFPRFLPIFPDFLERLSHLAPIY